MCMRKMYIKSSPISACYNSSFHGKSIIILYICRRWFWTIQELKIASVFKFNKFYEFRYCKWWAIWDSVLKSYEYNCFQKNCFLVHNMCCKGIIFFFNTNSDRKQYMYTWLRSITRVVDLVERVTRLKWQLPSYLPKIMDARTEVLNGIREDVKRWKEGCK